MPKGYADHRLQAIADGLRALKEMREGMGQPPGVADAAMQCLNEVWQSMEMSGRRIDDLERLAKQESARTGRMEVRLHELDQLLNGTRREREQLRAHLAAISERVCEDEDRGNVFAAIDRCERLYAGSSADLNTAGQWLREQENRLALSPDTLSWPERWKRLAVTLTTPRRPPLAAPVQRIIRDADERAVAEGIAADQWRAAAIDRTHDIERLTNELAEARAASARLQRSAQMADADALRALVVELSGLAVKMATALGEPHRALAADDGPSEGAPFPERVPHAFISEEGEEDSCAYEVVPGKNRCGWPELAHAPGAAARIKPLFCRGCGCRPCICHDRRKDPEKVRAASMAFNAAAGLAPAAPSSSVLAAAPPGEEHPDWEEVEKQLEDFRDKGGGVRAQVAVLKFKGLRKRYAQPAGALLSFEQGREKGQEEMRAVCLEAAIDSVKQSIGVSDGDPALIALAAAIDGAAP